MQPYTYLAVGTGVVLLFSTAFGITYNYGYDNGYSEANRLAQAATDKAIKELANDADKADVAFQLCASSGRLWDYGNNNCAER